MKRRHPPANKVDPSAETLGDGQSILESVIDPIVSDPLTDVTRAERRSLLLLSLAAVIVAQAGLIPSRIPAVEIELHASDRLALLYVLVVVLFYYLFAFYIYSRSDLRRRKAVQTLKRAPATEFATRLAERMKAADRAKRTPEELEQDLRELSRPADYMKMASDLEKFSTARVFFDCHLPLFVGATAIGVVLAETRGFPGWLFLTPLFALALTMVSGVYLWQNRKRISHWLGVRRHNYYFWRMRRLTGKLKDIPQDSVKREAFLAQHKRLFDKALRGPWV